MANGIWSTEKESTRGGALGRAFNLNAETFYLNDRKGPRTISKEEFTHKREYSEKELWENFENYIKEDSVIFDIGANTGIFSMIAKVYNNDCDIHSFEPQPNIFNYSSKEGVGCIEVAPKIYPDSFG